MVEADVVPAVDARVLLGEFFFFPVLINQSSVSIEVFASRIETFAPRNTEKVSATKPGQEAKESQRKLSLMGLDS